MQAKICIVIKKDALKAHISYYFICEMEETSLVENSYGENLIWISGCEILPKVSGINSFLYS